MLITNLTSNEYYLGDSDYYLEAQGALTLSNDTYNNDDSVANSVNNLYDSGSISVASTPAAFPREDTSRVTRIDSIGESVLHGPFTFNYDDAGLNDGIAFYTPVIGEVLLDYGVLIDEAFDGTTPRVDMGTAVGTTYGLFANSSGYQNLSGSVDNENAGEGMLVNSQGGPFDMTGLVGSNGGGRTSLIPIIAANPIKLWVSQDGQAGGAASGGTQGILRVFIVTAIPTGSAAAEGVSSEQISADSVEASVAAIEDMGVLVTRRITFTETAGAGVYTGEVVIPAGGVVHSIEAKTTADWDATTTLLDLGYTGALEFWEANSGIGGNGTTRPEGWSNGSNMPSPSYFPAGTSVVAEITTTGAGGPTGRTSVTVVYSVPPAATAAVKV